MRLPSTLCFALLSIVAVAVACGGDDDSTPDTGASRGGSAGSTGGGSAAKGGAANGGADNIGGSSSAGESGAEAGAAGSPVTSSPDVTGKVVDRHFQPLANVPVIVNGETAATNADGEFTVLDVDDTYSCAVVISDRKLAYYFVDLTRRDPTLQLYHVYPDDTPYTSEVTVDVTVAASPDTFDEYRFALDIDRADANRVVNYASTFKLDPFWRVSTSVDAELYALTFDLASPNFAYGQKSVTLVDDGLPMETVDLTLIQGTDRTATVTTPADYTPDTITAYLRFSDRVFVEVADGAGEELVFAYPDVPSTSMLVWSRAVSGSVATEAISIVPSDSETISIEHRSAASPLLPVDNATGISGETKFQYTASDGAIYVLEFQPDTALDAPMFVVVTPRTTTAIPDLSAVGLELPAATDYRWNVRTVGPYADIDAATGEDSYASFIKLGGGHLDAHLPERATLGFGFNRMFTTEP